MELGDEVLLLANVDEEVEGHALVFQVRQEVLVTDSGGVECLAVAAVQVDNTDFHH